MKKMKFLFTVLACILATLAATAQNIEVRGTVKDGAGNPVVGAGVVLRGNARVYAMSDATGAFRISVPADGTLSVTCLGYQEQTVLDHLVACSLLRLAERYLRQIVSAVMRVECD